MSKAKTLKLKHRYLKYLGNWSEFSSTLSTEASEFEPPFSMRCERELANWRDWTPVAPDRENFPIFATILHKYWGEAKRFGVTNDAIEKRIRSQMSVAKGTVCTLVSLLERLDEKQKPAEQANTHAKYESLTPRIIWEFASAIADERIPFFANGFDPGRKQGGLATRLMRDSKTQLSCLREYERIVTGEDKVLPDWMMEHLAITVQRCSRFLVHTLIENWLSVEDQSTVVQEEFLRDKLATVLVGYENAVEWELPMHRMLTSRIEE